MWGQQLNHSNESQPYDSPYYVEGRLYRRQNSRFIFILSAALYMCLGYAAPGQANAGEVLSNVTLIATTDHLYHGLTESTQNPTILVNSEFTLGEHLFTGFVASVARADKSVERHQPITGYLGSDVPIGHFASTQWYLGTTATYRKFLKSNKEWDYWEFSTQIRNSQGFSASLEYAPDYYAHNTTALIGRVSYLNEFQGDHYVQYNAGYAGFSDTTDYLFGDVSLGRIYGQSSIEIGYFWHNHPDEYRFRDPVQDSQLRLTYSRRLR
ncbi:MAG: hypothetical protein AAF541_02990 [Pseudomonadota bacterium]